MHDKPGGCFGNMSAAGLPQFLTDAPLDAADSTGALLRQLLGLAVPILAESVLHMVVGLTDTYLANNLPGGVAPSATAAVGTIAYILWFVGLLVGTIGTGATAIIARAKGARHRSLANSVCGQSVTTALLLGVGMAVMAYLGADAVVRMTRLSGQAPQFANTYLRLLALAIPFSTVMFIANACLRGAGDALTPAIVMIVVDLVNIVCSFALTYGWWGLPTMGFAGIAWGTVIAYVSGGVIQFLVLVLGRGGIRLYLHRLRPHWLTLKRLMRIGLPAGAEGLLVWLAQFGVVIVINHIDPTNIYASAHINAVRIEAASFMAGFAVAGAAATMVGQSLGMRKPQRAVRSAYLAYALGGGMMVICGLLFIFFGHLPAQWLSPRQPQIAHLTTRILWVAGFVQAGFAAAAIFGGALRGAGDTLSVMFLNLLSIVGFRFFSVLIVALVLKLGLVAIWVVLCVELMIRGALLYGRFRHGGWREVQV